MKSQNKAGNVEGARGKVDKYKNGKALICRGCREQFDHSVLKRNPGNKCPRCGGRIMSKVADATLTSNPNVAKRNMGGK